MGNKRLYESRTFIVSKVLEYTNIWHLRGRFSTGSERLRNTAPKTFNVRVSPDKRWRGVRALAFKSERVYVSESISYVSRRRVYGSGNWYISPLHEEYKGSFVFEDFDDILFRD